MEQYPVEHPNSDLKNEVSVYNSYRKGVREVLEKKYSIQNSEFLNQRKLLICLD